MRRAAIAGALVVAAIAVAVWQLRCGSESHDDTDPAAATGSASGSALGRRARTPGVPATPASLSGHVRRSSDGAGIANATVAIAPAAFGAAIFEATTTPTTVIAADASGAWTAPAIAPGNYVITAAAVGFTPGSAPKLVVGAGEHKTGIDVALDAGGTTVRGTVSDVGGGPIGGARITMRRSSLAGMLGGGEVAAMTVSDGTYAVTLPDGVWEATASHDDYTHAKKELELAGKPVTVDFVLVPGATIRGTVIARDTGKPVPGAIITAHGERASGSSERGAVADASGNFVVRSLPSGSIALRAVGRGYASAQPTYVSVGIGEPVDGVRVVVDRAYTISGNVVRKGKPKQGIAGIRLGVFSIGSERAEVAAEPTDADGAFEIIGVRPANYMFFAIGEGVMPELGKQVEVVDKDITGVIIEMASGVTLSGRVVPGQAASVALELPKGKIGLANLFESVKAMLVHGDADATGAFALRDVPPGSFTIAAHANDGSVGKLDIVVGDADQTNLVVKLEPRASIIGRVVDGNGVSVAGVHVEASPAREPESISIDFGGMQHRTEALTSSDGTFRIVGLDAGKVRLSVRDDQGTLAWANPAHKDKPREPVEVEVKTTELEGVTLTVEARDGMIRGVVLGTDGNPAADAWITAEQLADGDPKGKLGDQSEPVLTGADGKFVLTRLHRGTYELAVEGPRGLSHATKTGVKTGDTVTIQLEALGTLSGKVTGGGVPIAKYELACDHGGDREITSPDGSYTLERLLPGSYTCNVTAEGGTASGTVQVPAGPAHLDLELVPYATISGTVVSALGAEPLAGLDVVAEGGKSIAQTLAGNGPKTDATGRFTLDRQTAGSGALVIMGPVGLEPLATRPYTLTAGQHLELGTIRVVPPRKGEAGTFGLSTSVESGTLSVIQTKPGGPADLAGVKVGDKIVALDGHTVPEIGADLAKDALSSGRVGVGQRVLVTTDRGTAMLVAVPW